MTNSTASFTLTVFAILATSACTAAPEPESRRSDQALTTSVSPRGPIPSYVHLVSHSKFALGDAPIQKSEFGMDKVVGSQGVFATRPDTGWVLALPNADAPVTLVGPLATDGATHNTAVRAYFVGAGLPDDQIGSVRALAVMKGSGETAKFDITKSGATLDFYNSIITRQVNGVDVTDSFAWAHINANGDVVSESVYWPEIPASVVADAIAFAQVLADPTAGPALTSKLPPLGGMGHLAIRHTSGTWKGAFSSFASYDLSVQGRIRHFDRNGVEVALPEDGPLP